MSKVSFRARALDVSKPMPIYRAEEIPDLRDFDKINRAVVQMPTGMEKEEETETHLQNALTAQQFYGTAEVQAIPIPEIQGMDERYNKLYKPDFKPTKQYIHIQALGMEQEIPDYDLDSEDESWLNEQSKKMEITPLKFEEMMDRLEKGSGQQVVTLQEAKLLLKEDDDLIIAVYDYWLNKRLRLEMPLIPQVKSEKRDGTTTNNPYVAFRRRTEKMQTRKNRKNDEVSYEKMLKLKRDLCKAVTLLELIKRREKSKKEMLQLSIEILEKRYQMEDFSGSSLAEAEAERDKHPSFIPPYTLTARGQPGSFNGEEVPPIRKKRPYRRRNKQPQQQHPNTVASTAAVAATAASFADVDVLHHEMESSDDDLLSPAMSPSDHEDDNDPDGPFAFKRRRYCAYYAPLFNRLGNWPWCDPAEGGLGDKRHRFSLTMLPGGRCVGYARQRVGRGGRVILDRAHSPWDEALEKVDLSSHSCVGRTSEYITYIRERKIPFYRPQTPPPEDDALREEQWSSSHPATMAACPTAALASASEMNQETYQVHYEQLLQMQRDQETRRLNQDLSSAVVMGDEMGTPNNKVQHSFSSQPTSRFTLDSASAEFAATAVRSTAQLETSVVKSSSEPNFGIVSSLSNLVTSSANIASVTTVVSDAAVTIPSSSLISSISAVTQSLASLPSSTHSSIMVAKPQIASSASSSVTLSLPQMLVSASSTLPSVVSVFTPSLLQSHPPRHLLLQTAAGQQLATCNGPITASPVPSSLSSPSSLLQNKNGGLSTSPAASVLQLNFPITTAMAPRATVPSSTAIPSPSVAPQTILSPALSSSPVCAATVQPLGPGGAAASPLTMGTVGNTGVSASLPVGKMMVSKVLPQGVGVSGLLPAASSPMDILKQNHEDGNAVHMFNSDTAMPMDVS